MLLGLLLAGSARAAITCEQTGGAPGRETTVRVTIESPLDGDAVTPDGACGGSAIVTGTFEVIAPPPLYDFYIVLDASGSTSADSGSDVDGDGRLFGPGDTIYLAEIAAAQAFVRALDPAASRVAVIVFNRDAVVHQQLTADLAAAIAVLEALKSNRPRWGTGYVDAMEAVRLEMIARGDRVLRGQRCVFLSDGQPDETIAVIDAKSHELAALGLVMDTFALGFTASEALYDMAAITGGTFTALANPGDIVDLLPSFVPDVTHELQSIEEGSGAAGSVTTSGSTFEAIVPLRPGSNRVTLTLTAGDGITVSCTIDVTMPVPIVADAGPPVTSCAGSLVALSGAASSMAFPCAGHRYRWLDCEGAVIAGWSASPLLEVDPCSLPCEGVTLEVGCGTDSCVASDTTTVTCLGIVPPEPALAGRCGLKASLACRSADPALLASWDLDPLADADGDGDPRNDADAAGCDVTHEFESPGSREILAIVEDPATGCVAVRALTIRLEPPPAPRRIDGGLCTGASAEFSCGTADPALTYWWDFDDLADADGDGDPATDRDASGCDAAWAFLIAGNATIHGWSTDAAGCRALHSEGIMSIGTGVRPGEALDLRMGRDGDGIHATWAAVPGASAHRVLRGDLLALQSTGAYDHGADDAVSRGACEVSGPPAFADPDDAAGPEAWYYLVTAVSPCGGEGPTGWAFNGRSRSVRPGRAPTSGCP